MLGRRLIGAGLESTGARTKPAFRAATRWAYVSEASSWVVPFRAHQALYFAVPRRFKREG